ncbi:hypothetical protein MKO06_07675 [Gramella sp. GC03-9]|uniref:Uncharacterized protein n=1 Tax=Christiangramia oceanisediminis TaxID=2920386 RepID=A0A9X2IAC5_9FLAO|nr:hypothetical protein [Gramella oceanisediminis]MCP9199778.1 hypothetical protein [Gramella oceanisediminis]
MDSIPFYLLGGALIIIIGYIWIRLLQDNARQEKLISKHLKEISGLRYNRKNRENV